VNGALCGVAGVCLSMAQGNGFLLDMSAGRCSLPPMQSRLVWKASCCLTSAPVPVQLIQALPYLITVAIVAGFVRTARPPRALGKPYPPTR
jgi:ABC-type uncharacterized transport system permease subunit